MKALIDGDIFQHEFGSATDDEFKPLSWPLVQARVQGRINGILEATQADDYQIYLTTDDKSNFRYQIASIRPYKARRATEKPHWYTHIRNFLVDHRGAEEVSGMEADDAMSIAQYEDLEKCDGLSRIQSNNWSTLPEDAPDLKKSARTVICTRDKDLNMVPGWHYTWGAGKQKEQSMWWQSELGGKRAFYSQLLTGDVTDNIPGLFGVGKSSKLLKDINSIDNEHDLYLHVYKEYERRFGSYAEQFLTENARLLWMLRYEGEVWTPPVLKVEEEV